MRSVVIGGTGFLGLNLVAALQAKQMPVVATRRRSSNTIFARRLGVPLVTADCRDVKSMVVALQGCDVAFMVAGYYPRYSLNTPVQVEVAISEVRNVIAAAKRSGVRRLVYTGSVATIARPGEDRPACESDGLATIPNGSTYFAVKLAMEREVLRAAAAGVNVVVVCPTGCIGPYDHKVGTGQYVVAIANRSLRAYLNGTINVVDARDVAAGHVLAAQHGRPGERYILGGHNFGAADLLELIARCAGVPMSGRRLTQKAALALATSEERRCAELGERPALSREMVDMIIHGQAVGSQKAERELGYSCRPVRQSIKASLRWYRRHGYIRRGSDTP